MTNTQVSKLRIAFANNSSANIILSKTQSHKIVESGGRLGRVLISLGLTAAASATDAAIKKRSKRNN